MDDYSLVSLGDSKNEWCARLVNTLTPCVIEGLKSIFEEAWKLCVENDEEDKYLMTFQTFLSRIPKWNSDIINKERERIQESSGCVYLEDLITCVHIIQLKALTCVRVGQKQKKVDIDIPPVNNFIHKECVLNTVRDTMPVENILRAYMDETEELDVTEEIVVVNKEPLENEFKPEENIKIAADDTNSSRPLPIVPTIIKEPSISLEEEIIELPVKTLTAVQAPAPAPAQMIAPAPAQMIAPSPAQMIAPSSAPAITDKVNFTDVDAAISVNGVESNIKKKKTDERLENIANLAAERRKQEEEEEEEEDKIKIGGDVQLNITDINNLNQPVQINEVPIIDDIEVLG